MAAGISGVLIEGGGRLVGDLLIQRQIDYLFAYRAPLLFGDAKARPALEGLRTEKLAAGGIRLADVRNEVFGDDVPDPKPGRLSRKVPDRQDRVPSPGMNTFYITTAIDYVNRAPHLGHAYEKVLPMSSPSGGSSATSLFLTGTDEHGQKVQQTAQKQASPAGVRRPDERGFPRAVAQAGRFRTTTSFARPPGAPQAGRPRRPPAAPRPGRIYLGEYRGRTACGRSSSSRRKTGTPTGPGRRSSARSTEFLGAELLLQAEGPPGLACRVPLEERGLHLSHSARNRCSNSSRSR